VTDTLPAGVTFGSASGGGWTCSNVGNVSVTCTTAVLATGATAPVITVTVTAPTQGASLTNDASVSAATPDPDASNNSSSADTTVTPSADLAITKTGPATVVAGGSVTYQLSVTNNGPSDASGVSVTDTLPAGVTFASAAGTGWSCTHSGNVSVTCTRAALATVASAPDITVVVTAPAQAGSITNAAKVSATTADPNVTNNDAAATTTVSPLADLSMTKTGPPTVTAAGSVTYQLVVTNNGPSDAANLSVADTLPTGVTFASAAGAGWTCSNAGNVSVTCTTALLAAGATSPTITVVVTAPAQPGALTNFASVSSTTPDPDLTNNTASASTTVTGSADLAITKTGPATVVAGAAISYQLSVTNHGPSDGVNLVVSDSLPAGVTFVSAAGAGWTCSHSGNVSVTCTTALLGPGATAPAISVVVTAPTEAASLTNSASVSAASTDPDPSNNTSSVDTTVTPSADVSIVKVGPASAAAGDHVRYRLSVSNDGPSRAMNLSVTDTLPGRVTFVSAAGPGWTCSSSGDVSVTCTRPKLAAGATAPVISVVVAAPRHSAALTDTADVSNTVHDPDLSNNTSSVTTGIGPAADLSLVKSGPDEVVVGDPVTYHLVVSNRGPDDATSVKVVDTLPSGAGFVSAAGRGWTCGHDGDVSVTCTRATLANAAVAPTITVVVTAPSEPTDLTNNATVTAATLDLVPDNNSSSVPTVIISATTNGGGELPHTGAGGLGLAPLGLALIALGGALVVTGRRRSDG